MTHSSLTFCWALGCCLLAEVAPTWAQRYEVPVWEENSDEALAAVFKETTGQRIWKVRWMKSFYGNSTGEPSVEFVNGAYVLGPPGKSTGRLRQGQAALFWKSHKGERSRGWSPNEPFSWQNVQGMPIEDQCSTRYVMAKPPADGSSRPDDGLTERIYQRPILVRGELSPEESLSLIDATFRELVEERTRKPGDFTAASIAFDGKGNPNFGEISEISAKDPLNFFGLAEHPNRRCVSLSQRFNGTVGLVFEFQEGKAVLLDVLGIDY